MAAEFPGASYSRYSFETRLGEGSGGVVYRALDRETSAIVAVKTLRSVTAEQIALLKNEFRAVQGLRHPNLVQLGELHEEAGQWFLSMEYVLGVDFLARVAKRDGGFSEGKLREALRQLASALVALHGARIVHRDIKPSNVLVTDEGRVVVLDFGIALREERPRLRDDGITGTALFMAPEQAAGEAVGPAADWYAVGAMLFLALTGKAPFEGLSHEILQRKISEEARSPRSLVSGLPDDLATLCERLIRLEPGDRPNGGEVLQQLGVRSMLPAAPGNARAVPLLGRDKELAWLRSAFDATDRGAVTVIIQGESGVGKSLLLRTFIDEQRRAQPGLVALLSRCYARESVPFKAFDGAAEGLVAILEDTPRAELAPWLSEYAGLLPRLFPELGLVPALAELASQTTVEDPKEARRHGFEALRRLLVGLASSRPLLLLVDDLQWADADSVALLRVLLEPVGAPRLFLLCTLRVGTDVTGRGHDFAEQLPGDVRSLRLEKLRPAESEKFLQELIAHEGMAPLAPEEIETLIRESDGHPMFLTELVFGWQQRDQGASHHKLDDALRARVRKLPSPMYRLLLAICVAGLPIPERVAAHAASADGAELMGAVPWLAAERLIQTWGSGRDTRVEPYHDRVRVCVLASLSDEQLRGFHGKLALALEQAAETADAEVLAQHWLEAGDRERALSYMLRAAEKAKSVLAFERAVVFYGQALELCGDQLLRKSLRLSLAEALTNAGRLGEAAEGRLALAEKASPFEAQQLRTVAAEQLLCSGRFDQGVTVLEGVLRTARLFVPMSPWGTLLALLFARLALAIRGLEPRRGGIRLSPAREVRIDALMSAGYGFGMSDSVRSNYFMSRALILALDAGEPTRLARSLCAEASFRSVGGLPNRKKTLALIARMRRLAEELKTPLAEALLGLTTSYYHYWLGEWVEAKRENFRAEKLFADRCLGQFWAKSTVRTMGFRAMIYLGEIEELAVRVAAALREMEQVGDIYGISNLRAGPLAWLRLADDQVETAEQELAQVAELIPKSRFVVQNYFHMNASVQLDIYRGRPREAHERIERDWGPLRRSLLLRVSMVKVIGLELRGRAALAWAAELTESKRAKRLSAIESIAAQLAKLGYTCGDGFVGMLRAGVASLRGDAVATRRHCQEAERAFESASMKLHATVSRWCQGVAEGGDEGGASVARAREQLALEGIRCPERFAALLAPGVLCAPTAPAAPGDDRVAANR